MTGQGAFEVEALAANDASGILSPFKLTRRLPQATDVVIDIFYCGICHSDLHQIKNGWGTALYPVVPGHEIVGVVAQIGNQVTKFKLGDHVGVGCMVDSCRTCDSCNQGLENYCPKAVYTYNSRLADGTHTLGGYSTCIVVDESFVIRIPESLPLDSAAPLLCAGITVYSPMKYYGMVEAGKSFGVVGLGGLGHVAVKLGKAFGMKVTVISTSPSKEKEAKEVLGADAFLSSKDTKQMMAAAKTIDYIIDTVSAPHPLEPLLSLLKINGKLVLVGVPEKPLQLNPKSIIFGRKLVGGSLIGGIQETQEMMDFCGDKNVSAIIEKVDLSPESVNHALARLENSDVKYRFVIQVKSPA